MTDGPDSHLLFAAISPKSVLWLAAAPVVALALRQSFFGKPSRRAAQAVLVIAAAYGLLHLATIAKGVHEPREWDFKHFWSWGVAVTEGTSPYDHENLIRIIEPVGAGEDLRDELHCFYPPPSLLLFAPLGWLPFKASLAVWSLVQVAALAGCIWLLLREFAADADPLFRSVLVLLAVATWATSMTFAVAQTNFLVLLAVLLFWRDRDRPLAGVWLTLGATVKPLVALLGLYLLVRGAWRAIAAAVLTGVGLLVATCLLLGPGIFSDFLEREGVSEHYLPAQGLNQSLSGVLLRAFNTDTTTAGLLERPLLLSILAAVAITTGAVIARTRRGDGRRPLAATIAMMLLVYPGTLAHYSVQLLPPLAWLLADSKRTGRGRWVAIAVTTLAVVFIAVKATFWANLAVWIVAAAFAVVAPTSLDGETSETPGAATTGP